MNRQTILESLAGLLSYPGADTMHQVGDCCETLERELSGRLDTAALDGLRRYRTAISILSREDLEEIYTRTFDLNPVCSLDIGWHLYAENYDRGTFLVEMRNALKEHGIGESAELPDHLPTVLRLLARMEPARGAALTGTSVLPAVQKMIGGFSDTRNPYAAIVGILEPVLKTALTIESGVPAHDDHR